MAIALPERLDFDPYHESGIVITRAANRIRMELPRNYFGNIPGFIFGGLFMAIGGLLVTSGLWHFQWGLVAFGFVFASISAGLTLLPGFYFASVRAVVEVTSDELIITHLGWGQDADPFRICWNEITEIRIAPLPHDREEKGIGLLFEMRDKGVHLELSGRPIGELERLHALLRSLLPAATPAAENPAPDSKRQPTTL